MSDHPHYRQTTIYGIRPSAPMVWLNKAVSSTCSPVVRSDPVGTATSVGRLDVDRGHTYPPGDDRECDKGVRPTLGHLLKAIATFGLLAKT